ncbi:hypothetical protein I5Q83_05860 [Enterocloster clostridioformis]|nr:hypothetical protein [Enterocloster clostridioformis]QQR01840.1 hypothetical protein I5Q83_05860 [Enterocloster clostridioformis]
MQQIEINENGIHMVLEIIRSQEEKHAFRLVEVNLSGLDRPEDGGIGHP